MPETILVARLKAVTGVTDLVSTRIWPGYRKEGTALPAVVYEMTGEEVINFAGGTTGTAETHITLSCIASTYSGAKALAAAVATALSGWADANGCIWHLDNQADDFGEIISGQDVLEYYAVIQEYSVWN